MHPSVPDHCGSVSTMIQNRRVHLTTLSAEWDIMRQVNLDKVLSDFSGAESPK